MTRRGGVVWPLVLIAVGLVFLLANFGYLPSFSVVALLSLWPLVLILVGVDIAIGRRWPLAALAIDVGIIALGLALVVAQPAFTGPVLFGGTGETDVNVPREGATTLALHLNGGAGRYGLSGGSSALVDAHSDAADLRLRSVDRSGGRVEVRVDQGVSGGPLRFGGRPANVDARVASDIPTSLDLSGGAGEFVFDLGNVRVTDARINAGASSVQLTLPRPTGDVGIRVSAGASSVVVEVPADVEARVNTTGAIVSLRSTSPRVSVTGGVAETAGYGGAKDRVTVTIIAGASSVTVR